MDNLEIRNKLNAQNLNLLQEIESTMLPVIFEEWSNNHYASKIAKSQSCGVVYCRPDLNQAKIAHELLHVKTGFLLGDCIIMLQIVGQCNVPLAELIIHDSFCEGLVNQTEHYLFYNEYLAMGYNTADFFESHAVPQSAQLWIDQFEKKGLGSNGIYNKTEVHAFLSVLILLMLYPVKGQYKHQLKRLSKVNPALFDIMKRYVNSLNNIKLTANDRNKLQDAYKDLANSIISWVGANRVLPI